MEKKCFFVTLLLSSALFGSLYYINVVTLTSFYAMLYITLLIFSVAAVTFLFTYNRYAKKSGAFQKIISTDPLTSLLNRRGVDTFIEDLISKNRKKDGKFAILYLDMDNFKVINDTLGHNIGDLVLIESAKRLSNITRENDAVGRIGGDEFVLMIDDVQEEKQAILMAQRVIEKFEVPLYIENHKIDANFSIGVSIYPSNGITQKELFKSADIAMYQAKSEGKNMFKAYTSELDEKVQKNILLNQQLENALKNSEFIILYQPKLNLNDSSIKEAEALIRWKQGEKLVSAAEFIPVAERSSMIIKIGDWVIDTVCKQIKYFEQQSTPTRISINISNAQLKECNFVSNVSRMISFYDITPSLIEFEISESILVNNSDRLIPVLTELKKLGIKLAIDEFGKGFSSMGYMSRLPIDKIKIDKTLMNEIFSTKHRSLISAMISLGHALDLSVTAEGIEIDKHLQESIKLNADSAQGYFLAEPLAAEELLNFYLSKKGDKAS